MSRETAGMRECSICGLSDAGDTVLVCDRSDCPKEGNQPTTRASRLRALTPCGELDVALEPLRPLICGRDEYWCPRCQTIREGADLLDEALLIAEGMEEVVGAVKKRGAHVSHTHVLRNFLARLRGETT